jgi:hypothetical protein
MMTTDHILALLLRERNKLTKAIEALQGPKRKGRPPGPGRKAVTPSVEPDSHPPQSVDPTAPAKRKMSAAGRRAIIAATKKRWAAVRAAKVAAAAPAPAAASKAAPAKTSVPVKKHGLTAAGRKALSIAMKKRWAARKKAAAKGKAF